MLSDSEIVTFISTEPTEANEEDDASQLKTSNLS